MHRRYSRYLPTPRRAFSAVERRSIYGIRWKRVNGLRTQEGGQGWEVASLSFDTPGTSSAQLSL